MMPGNISRRLEKLEVKAGDLAPKVRVLFARDLVDGRVPDAQPGEHIIVIELVDAKALAHA